MLGEELISAVGPGKPNQQHDVLIVQRLLDRSAGFVGAVMVTGNFDQTTATAILNFQRRVMRQSFPTGAISPGDETFWFLSETRPRRMLAGSLGGIVLAPYTGDAQFSEEDFKSAAKALGCEARSIKAVKGVESPFGPFDKALQHAYALNAGAALKAASWGGFQILGMNHKAAGYGTVDQFVRAMCQSAAQQIDAFVSFIKADSALLSAIRNKNWALFALHYNGSAYAKNRYDTQLAEKYRIATE